MVRQLKPALHSALSILFTIRPIRSTPPARSFVTDHCCECTYLCFRSVTWSSASQWTVWQLLAPSRAVQRASVGAQRFWSCLLPPAAGKHALGMAPGVCRSSARYLMASRLQGADLLARGKIQCKHVPWQSPGTPTGQSQRKLLGSRLMLVEAQTAGQAFLRQTHRRCPLAP